VWEELGGIHLQFIWQSSPQGAVMGLFVCRLNPRVTVQCTVYILHTLCSLLVHHHHHHHHHHHLQLCVGVLAGKVFPKLKRKSGPAAMLSSLIGSSVAEEAGTSSTTSSQSSVTSIEDCSAPIEDEGNEALDYVFRIVYMPRPETSIGRSVDWSAGRFIKKI